MRLVMRSTMEGGGRGGRGGGRGGRGRGGGGGGEGREGGKGKGNGEGEGSGGKSKPSNYLKKCHVAIWYFLCIAFHAVAVTGDISTLGFFILSVSGVGGSPSSSSSPSPSSSSTSSPSVSPSLSSSPSPSSFKTQMPTFGGGAVFLSDSRAEASFMRHGSGKRGYSFGRQCSNCVFYEGWKMSKSLVSWQLFADFIIAVAYLSVPIQLYYFSKKSKSVPYARILVQFGAFLAMCGVSHFLNLWSYNGLPRVLMLFVTAVKLLSAILSCSAALTLVGVIPDLLGVHQREIYLREKVDDLDQEVLTILRREDTAMKILTITGAIRSTLDRDSIGSTACVELKELLRLENVALWLPTRNGTTLELAYESERRATPVLAEIPISDSTIQEVVASGKAMIISGTSQIADNTRFTPLKGMGIMDANSVVAVPLPLLSGIEVANNPMANLASSQSISFALMVLVLPQKGSQQIHQELLETAETIADQVAVALAHAAVLEESQRVRDQLTLQEKNLRLAEFEGKSAVRARDHFLTVMKHEMRTPMHSITALSSLLAEADLEEEQHSMVETVARSSALLSTLVSDILDFWRLEDDSVSLNVGAFELTELVKEAETLVAPIAKDKGLTLTFKPETNLPAKVTGDSNRLLQVLLNVVGNAIKCTASGGSVTVSVSLEKMESARDGFVLKAEAGHLFVRFEVKDTGVDLLEKDIPRLFEKFQDDDGKVSRTGLGLALSRKFVQLSDGHVWIVSGGPGGGASCKFIVRLKLEEDDGKEEEKEDEWDVPDVNFYALRIMVVDDNMINRLVTKRLLESIGSSTKVVDSGKECLRLLKERKEEEDPYDVLLLDLMMPEMDGYTTATKILEEVPEKNRPVIVALTANADETTKEKCLEHGMVGMITKPISLNPLRDILGKMLDNNAKK